jgi:Ran GTPase-activating protein (RanGAP) involved in mRNA processing and transport
MPRQRHKHKQRRGSREILGIENIVVTGLFYEWWDEIDQGSQTVTAFDEDINDTEGAKKIAQLGSNTTLRDLNFCGSDLREVGFQTLADALAKNRALTCLTCVDCELGNGVGLLAPALAREDPTLSKLVFQRTPLDDTGVENLAQSLVNNNVLTELDLSYAGLHDSSAEQIAFVLNSTSITRLNLESNKFTQCCAKAFSDLANNSKLQHLNLSGNTDFGDAGASAIAEGLKGNEHLQELYLHLCTIGNEGVSQLAIALRANTSLTDLRLGGNHDIGDYAADYLAEALRKNTTLTQLTLSGSQITNKGAKKFAGMLSHNSTLLELGLGHMDITEDIDALVTQLKEMNDDHSESMVKITLDQQSAPAKERTQDSGDDESGPEA